jgi:hypothetical protein
MNNSKLEQEDLSKEALVDKALGDLDLDLKGFMVVKVDLNKDSRIHLETFLRNSRNFLEELLVEPREVVLDNRDNLKERAKILL